MNDSTDPKREPFEWTVGPPPPGSIPERIDWFTILTVAGLTIAIGIMLGFMIYFGQTK